MNSGWIRNLARSLISGRVFDWLNVIGQDLTTERRNFHALQLRFCANGGSDRGSHSHWNVLTSNGFVWHKTPAYRSKVHMAFRYCQAIDLAIARVLLWSSDRSRPLEWQRQRFCDGFMVPKRNASRGFKRLLGNGLSFPLTVMVYRHRSWLCNQAVENRRTRR